MSKHNAESITDKVFDTDNNPVSARLLVWGPEEVDGEDCIIVEPTDFLGSLVPNPHYDGQHKPMIAADDLRLAVPVGFFPSPDKSREAIAFLRRWMADPTTEERDGCEAIAKALAMAVA